MTRGRKRLLPLFIFLITLSFLLTACANLPLIGKKKNEKADKTPEGKTVTIEGMGKIKGVNPPKTEAPSPKPPPTPPTQRRDPDPKVASTPTRPFSSPPLPFFQFGFKRKVAILDFENKTTYEEEKIGEMVAKKLSDKLEATQRVITVDKTVVSAMLNQEGFKFESLKTPSVMKRTYQSLGIQAFALG